jgi:S-adenosylmethionine hydrolase
MAGPIVLLTDFGLDDAYVGVMKGVILRISPDVPIVDLCHQVAPQAIAEGAFLLATSYRYFAPDAIFVAVVDPGVGSERRPIALKTPHGTFVGPDNGLFGLVARDFGVAVPEEGGRASLIGSRVEGVVLTDKRYFLPEVSATFHGRDVFAPVAAHLSLGAPLVALGSPLTDLVVLATPHPERRGNTIVGHIIHVDRFGNLITDVTAGDVRKLARPVVDVAGRRIHGVSQHYAERPGLLALVGSSGYLEIALNGGSAAAELGLRVGDSIILSDE